MDGNYLDLQDSLADERLAHSRLKQAAKRVLDLLIALSALVFLSPVLAAIAILVKLQDGGPAIFSHTRIGRGGKPFHCYKFRSMVMDAQGKLDALLASNPDAAAEWARDQKLQNDPRITALGQFIRKSSLDELPQLLNIIKGDMSLVGPRPIIAEEVVRYGKLFDAYASVNPGVTGPWQVSGRNYVSYETRVQLDADYAAKWTVLGDIWIILKTVPAVLLSRGAS